MKTRAAVYVEVGKPMVIDEVELPVKSKVRAAIRELANPCDQHLRCAN